ncbi:hypothetical protein [Natrinema longum]|uniref:Uncharacterized protein n=1 Tax=Natrinema longum TaxID=370324 RepID=A0A8A2UBQ2_9EURY|nr:hypothetical protein [Natrinema longum]MBZ6496001.1 hypothetical protein [Natrinema longum]QSW86067.1 hypothetical protein J0X27_04340 [Natrinema longum]
MAEYRGYLKWLLFFSSFTPLYAILMFKHWGFKVTVDHRYLSEYTGIESIDVPILTVLWIILTIASLFGLWLAISVRKTKEPKWTDVESYRSRNDLITSYILVYIFPFVVLDYTEVGNWLAFGVFFIVIGIVQVRSNQLHVNPVLAIFNYDIYEIDTGRKQITLISRKNPDKFPESVQTIELSNDVHIAAY